MLRTGAGRFGLVFIMIKSKKHFQYDLIQNIVGWTCVFSFFSRIYEFTFLSNPVINEGRGANPIYNGILETFTYRQNIILSMEGHLKLRLHSLKITDFTVQFVI